MVFLLYLVEQDVLYFKANPLLTFHKQQRIKKIDYTARKISQKSEICCVKFCQCFFFLDLSKIT